MTSFTSSFKSVVFDRQHRRPDVAVAIVMACTFAVVTTACHFWLRHTLRMERQYAASLKPDSDVLVVGSSHLFGIQPVRNKRKAANLSHRANGLQMIAQVVRSAVDRSPNIDTVLIEVGHLVVGGDPMQIRDHGFRELGVRSWELPGTLGEKIRHVVDSFPPLRIPRLTPETILKRLRPELGVEAEGFTIERTDSYTDNADYRIDHIRTVLSPENEEQRRANLSALTQLVHDLQQRNVETVIIVTPHDESFRRQVTARQNDLLQHALDLAKDAGALRIINLYESDMELLDRKNFVDSDHLNERGQKLMNDKISQMMGWTE